MKPSALTKILNLNEFEDQAKQRLPAPLFEYLSGGAEDNDSFKGNLGSFDDIWFVPRSLVDVSKVDTRIELLGKTYDSPFGIAPMGLSSLFAFRGDINFAEIAKQSNIPMVISGSSLIPLEQIVKVNPFAWFQAYLPNGWEPSKALISRAMNAGVETLVITVDTPVAANRENNIRKGFSTPIRPSARLIFEGLSKPRWLMGTFFKTLVQLGLPHFENNYAERGAPILSRNVIRDISDRGSLDWNRLEKIRAFWTGKLVIKGVVNTDDATRLKEIGVDGLIVSNHGGRQLDGVVPPLYVLADIVDACPSIEVMYDSGIRRGVDALKAMALGAKCVFVGRPFGFANACAGAEGVQHATQIMQAEISRNMALLGVTHLKELNAQFLKDVRHLK